MLLVVLYHAGVPLSGGFIGVDVFFAISGFVITSMLLSELTSSNRINLPRFYLRRIKRLLPALAVMLTVVAALGTLASPLGAQRIGALTGMWASVFGANFYLYTLHTGYFDVSTSLDPLLHTWTLAVEEQFYLVFPAVLLVGWYLGSKLRRSRGIAILLIAQLSLGSFVLASKYSSGLRLGGVAAPERLGFYGSPSRAWEFGVGCLLALVIPVLPRLPLLAGSALGTVGVVLLAFGAVAIHGGASFSAGAALLPVGGTCALLLAGTASHNTVSRLLAVRPAVWIGDLSYSWYLWHWPLIVFALALWPGVGWAAPAAAALALLVAHASYRYVENPVRYRLQIKGRSAVVLVGVCIVIPVAAAAGLLAAHRALFTSSAMAAWRQAELLHEDAVRGCDNPNPLGARARTTAVTPCIWRIPAAKGEVVLIGDSNAGQFTEPFVRAAEQAGFNATVATLSSCPFVDLRVEGTGDVASKCRPFETGSLAALLRLRPSLVVMAARSDLYVEGRSIGLALPGATTTAWDAKGKAALWSKGTRSVVAALNRAGVPVILVHPIPSLPVEPQACAAVLILTGSCTGSASRRAVDRSLERVVAAERSALSGLPAAYALDFEDDLCSAVTCSSMRGSRIMYRDSGHLSILGALTLERRFYEAIRARARS